MTRKLVVYDDSEQNFHVLDPMAKAGIGLPAFRYGMNRPAVATVKGEAFINEQTGIASVWNGAQWVDIAKPVIAEFPDDATLLGAQVPDKTVALSVATGNLFSRVGAQWLPINIRVYPTQAGMIADTPPNGAVGFAEDTGALAVRAGNQWAALTNLGVTVGNTAVPNPLVGQQWFETQTQTLWTWDGTNWMPPAGGLPIGSIITHVNVTPPPGYLLCDGAAIPADTRYDTLRGLCGSNVPDLRDMFIRGTGTQSEIAGFVQHDDTTRAPRTNAFRAQGDTSNGGNHRHHINADNAANNWSGGSDWDHVQATWRQSGGSNTTYDGLHHHTIDVPVHGGDSETAPKHVRLAYHIKAL